jgi:hypothetical protein
MKIAKRLMSFAAMAVALELAIPIRAKQQVIFTSPCECIGNHGVSRWAAKTDLQEPPTSNENLKTVVPSQIVSWKGPGARINQRSERIAPENQWYAVTGRIDKVKAEDDGDIHIVLRDVSDNAGIVVEIPLGPRWCELRKLVFSWTDAQFPLSSGFRTLQHPVITVIGKSFYDIDHSGNDTVMNRRNYDRSLAVWEIHPIMKIIVEPANSSTAASSFTRGTSATPRLSPATSQQFITLRGPVSIQVPYGTTVLQPGTKLQVLSREAQTVDVRYLDARYSIPISSTDAE